MTELPEVTELEQASRQLGLAASVSELHGALCGWLAGGGADVAGWPAKVMADEDLPEPSPGDALDRMRQATAEQLENRDFAFELLLAGDDAELAQRTAGLFEWCRAFLGGFGLAAGGQPALSEESEEALNDLARLAQAAGEEFESAEEDESALAEIEEFVRVAVLLLHSDRVLGARHRQRLN